MYVVHLNEEKTTDIKLCRDRISCTMKELVLRTDDVPRQLTKSIISNSRSRTMRGKSNEDLATEEYSKMYWKACLYFTYCLRKMASSVVRPERVRNLAGRLESGKQQDLLPIYNIEFSSSSSWATHLLQF